MAPLNSDKFKKVAPNTGWQLDASGISDAVVDSFGLVSATGLPTGTGVKITIDRVDSAGTLTPDKMERIDGVISGNSVISCVRGSEGTAQAHAGGAVVEIVISADLYNDLVDGILAEHGQDGSHIAPATAKTSLVDADSMGLFDSAASFISKKITWANIKAALLTYFYTIFPAKDGWMPVSVSWAYAGADAPTFTITVPAGAASLYSPGMRIKLTQTTVKYFIITAVADTVLTVYGGTDYTLVSAAISDVSYSVQKAPLGFPLDPLKWTVETHIATDRDAGAGTANTWYNPNADCSIVIPIGAWRVLYSAAAYGSASGAATALQSKCTLSTANNSESDTDFTTSNYLYTSTSDIKRSIFNATTEKFLLLAAKSTRYLNVSFNINTTVSALYGSTQKPTIIRAVCAYL